MFLTPSGFISLDRSFLALLYSKFQIFNFTTPFLPTITPPPPIKWNVGKANHDY